MQRGGVLSFFAFSVLVGFSFLVACSNAGGDAGSRTGPPCGALTVQDTNLQQCAGCSPASPCTSAAPLDACCSWVAAPNDPLIDGTGLHRYSAPPDALPSLSCLTSVVPLETPQRVTLTGYVWLYSSGQDSAGVQVDVFEENDPNTDGTIASPALGTYTTTTTDPIDPTDTSWNSHCANGCSYRQYTIQNVPTETPLVIKTSDAGSTQFATLYEYNVYLASSDVQNGTVTYDAEAIAGSDLTALAGMAGQTFLPNMGALVGEVHDCNDVRLGGATVGSDAPGGPPTYYFTSDESDPLLSVEQTDTTVLGRYGLINVQPGAPVRVSAVAVDPDQAGQYLMLGTYTVQITPGAVTALVLRGRRPWQP